MGYDKNCPCVLIAPEWDTGCLYPPPPLCKLGINLAPNLIWYQLK